LFCPACKKTFDNENVFHHHKKGKKHIKSINKLNKQKISGDLTLFEEKPSEFSQIQIDRLKKTALMETWILRLKNLLEEIVEST
jgi:hypothetical protein